MVWGDNVPGGWVSFSNGPVVVKITGQLFEETASYGGTSRVQFVAPVETRDGKRLRMRCGQRLIEAIKECEPNPIGVFLRIERTGEGFGTQYVVSAQLF